MQEALGWSKRHWPILACVALPVLAVPAAVWFALDWDKKVVAAAQARVDADMKELRNPNITYDLPGIKPTDSAVEWTGVPNKAAIEAFGAARTSRMESANAIVSAAVEFNKGQRKALVEGLFPEPPAGSQQAQREMARRFNREAQGELLRSINAGPPIATAEVLSRLNDRRGEFLQRLGGGAGGTAPTEQTLSAEQASALATELLGVRMDAYRGRAGQVLTYADVSVFVLPTIGGEATVPSMAECWEWQMQYWIQADLIAAIGAVNEPAKNTGVTGAAVKRIERIAVLPGVTGPGAVPEGGTPDPAAPAPLVEGTDFISSFTGRRSDPNMDVRKAELTVVVSNAQLPLLLSSISKTNLMTVTNVKLSAVDVSSDLSNGFYYGSDPVVRATLTIETVWLNEWLKALKPKTAGQGTNDPNAPQPGGGDWMPPLGG
jgi:hypothetical protein